MMAKTKHIDLAARKVESSGLTIDNAKALGMRPLNEEETNKLFPDRKIPAKVPSLLIQYHDINGKPIKGMYRVRLLQPPMGVFGQTDETRYLQPPDTPPAVYWAKSIQWNKVLKDPTIDITITEGELKAACACKYNGPCIGLGGVWSWRSKKLGWSFLPDLERVEWARRRVVIAYDSDMASNPQVCAAVGALTKELRARGAIPAVATIPSPDGKKYGLDDFLMEFGPKSLSDVLGDATTDDTALQLWEHNSDYCMVREPMLVYCESRNHRYPLAAYRALLSNHELALLPTSPQGNLRKSDMATEWIKWPMRRTAHKFVFSPGQPPTVNEDGRLCLNQWPGWGCESIRGDVRPWKDMLAYLFRGAPAEEMRWFENWALYPIAFPGTKCEAAAVLWSRHKGLGKSVIGKTLKRIYGDGYNEVSQRELEDNFTDWYAYRQLVMIDDVSAFDSRSKADVLKKIITEELQQVNTKGIPKYSLRACCNFYITSNKPNAIYIESDDRRFFVHEVIAAKAPREFYDRYYAWMNAGGPAALRFYAENKHDFGSFNPTAEPPDSGSKRAMIDASRSELEAWLADAADDPDEYLRIGRVVVPRDVFSARELLTFFDSHRTGHPVTVGKMIIEAQQVFPFASRDGRLPGLPGRWFVVRDQERWRTSKPAAVAAHIEGARKNENASREKKKKY